MDDLDRSIQSRVERNPHYAELLDETMRRLADYKSDPEREAREWAEFEAHPDPIVTRRVRSQKAKGASRK